MPVSKTKPLCGAKLYGKEGTCRMSAGAGTDHLGYGVCKKHGGNAPGQKKQAEKIQGAAMLAEWRATIAKTYGEAVEIDANSALLEEIARTNGHVLWLGSLVADSDIRDLKQYATTETGAMWEKPSIWLELYQKERQHLVNVCKIAIASGIAERQVKIAEEQGMLFAKAITDIFTALDLTPEQKKIAPTIARKILLELPMKVESVRTE